MRKEELKTMAKMALKEVGSWFAKGVKDIPKNAWWCVKKIFWTVKIGVGFCLTLLRGGKSVLYRVWEWRKQRKIRQAAAKTAQPPSPPQPSPPTPQGAGAPATLLPPAPPAKPPTPSEISTASFWEYRARFLFSALTILLIIGLSLSLGLLSSFGVAKISPRLEWAGIMVGVASGFFLLIAFLYQGFRMVPADPPTVGVLIVLGKRVNRIIKEGWRFFPLYKLLTNAMPVRITKVNQDLTEQLVRTPDRAESAVLVSITWQPDYQNPQNLISFLNSGGEEGVKNILQDIVRDRMRTWAMSTQEGPADWKEAMGAGDEATAVLLKAILGSELRAIPRFPTSALLKYFSVPQVLPSQYEQKNWGENWENLKAELEKLDDAERRQIQQSTEERREAIKKARQGNGHFPKRDLGIIVNRFTINTIALSGETAKAAESQAKEEQEREGEKIEANFLVEMVNTIADGLGIPREQALQAFQAERDKVKMTTSQSQLRVSSDTMKELKEMVIEGIKALVKKSP